MKYLTDKKKIERLERNLVDIVEDSIHLKINYVKKKNWVTVPIGTDFFYDENYIRRLPRVMKQIGVKSCFAIATEPLLPESNYFEFETTKKGLSAFHWECGLFRFALFPEDLSFFILWTVDDYFLIAGEREFVESAIGSSVETAFEKFKEWAIGWPTEVNGIRLGVREFLLGIYARYKAVNDEILKNNEEG